MEGSAQSDIVCDVLAAVGGNSRAHGLASVERCVQMREGVGLLAPFHSYTASLPYTEGEKGEGIFISIRAWDKVQPSFRGRDASNLQIKSSL